MGFLLYLPTILVAGSDSDKPRGVGVLRYQSCQSKGRRVSWKISKTIEGTTIIPLIAIGFGFGGCEVLSGPHHACIRNVSLILANTDAAKALLS